MTLRAELAQLVFSFCRLFLVFSPIEPMSFKILVTPSRYGKPLLIPALGGLGCLSFVLSHR